MKCFFILLLHFFVRVRCETVFQNGQDVMSPRHLDNDETDVLASVREYPSLLHKCTATFIKEDVLLTTARCLYCEDCKMFLHALSTHLTDEDNKKGASYNISNTVIHPKYERVPQKFDIGLIKLDKKVPKAAVFELPKIIYETPGMDVVSYRWRFTSDYRGYFLEKMAENTLSNGMCSLLLNEYIDYKHICARREAPLSLGQFDQGIPLILKEVNQSVILGIYGKEGTTAPSKVKVYNSIFPYVDWIQDIIRCDFKCTSAERGQHFTPSSNNSPSPIEDDSDSSKNHISASDTQEYITTPQISAEDLGMTAKQPNADGDDADPNLRKKKHTMEPGGNNRRMKPKPVKWTADFPFSEEKKTPFVPKDFPA